MEASPSTAPAWPRFLRIAMFTALGAGLAIYALLIVVDGYDTVFFSPAFDREPVTSNQRFSFPALARKDRFDSAIVGTSTARLLQPRQLDPLFNARFVNLAMNDATAWEESRIFHVFQRHHPNPRAVIFGIDAVWCEAGADYRKLTPRPFPEWMYDTSRWNDLLNLFNLPAVEEMGRQFGYLTGLRKAKYGKDGYTNFLPPDEVYNLERAQLRIYGLKGPQPRVPVDPPVVLSPAEVARLRFPMHDLLREMLRSLPADTVKLFAIMPYHVASQPVPGSRPAAVWVECKRRLAALAGANANAHVVDFMVDSAITTRDRNYWDPLHFNLAVAAELGRLMAEAVREKRDNPAAYRYLRPSG